MTTSRKKILYIEDEPDIRQIVTMSLEMMGNYHVSGHGTAAEALVQAASVNPDLILTDYLLPDKDAPQLIKELRAIPKMAEVPVVLMTAHGDDMSDAMAELGLLGIITKPFNPETLATELDVLINAVKP